MLPIASPKPVHCTTAVTCGNSHSNLL